MVSCPLAPPAFGANPAHRLHRKWASRTVGPTLRRRAISIAGSGGDGQQWIAPRAGIRPWLLANYLQSVQISQLVESRSMVNGARRAGPLPGPGQQLAAHPVQLADVAFQVKLPAVPRVERFDYAAESAGRPCASIGKSSMRRRFASAEAPGSSSCRRCSPGPARSAEVEVLPEELGKARRSDEGGGKDPRLGRPGVGRRRRFGCGRGGCVVAW